jgi:hypothetical protein
MDPKTSDDGRDLQSGDTVWIKGTVMGKVSETGDAEIRCLPRPGYDEYGHTRIAAIFLIRDSEMQRRIDAPKADPISMVINQSLGFFFGIVTSSVILLVLHYGFHL